MAQGKVGSLYFTLGVNASDFEKKLNMATAKIADFGKNAERVGRSLSMSLTLPLSLLGGAAAKTAMDFETSMAKIEGLVGVAGDEVRAMGDEARKMAIKMGKSANEAAEALFFITSAGLRGKEAMDVLAASMQASVAGLGETKVVADLATSAVNAYGAANLGATEATDVMVAAVREGKLETNELAQSMGRVLPLASAMGVSFNEVGAAFAALSRTGTNASEAATQIRGILSSLLNPSKQAADELERLGLSGEMIRQVIKEDGLLAALELLKDRFEGNEEAAALVFGNIRALSGVLDLLGANVDTTRQIFENMNDVAGDTQAAFDVMAQTAQFKLNTAIASAKDGLIDLGSAIMISLTPVLEKLAEGLKNITEWYRSLDSDTQQMIIRFGMLAAAIGPALVAIGKLSTALAFLAANPISLAVIGLVALAVALKDIRGTFDTKPIVEMAKGLGILTEAMNSLVPIYDRLNSVKRAGNELSKEEKEAILDTLKAKKAEIIYNRELLQGMLAVSKARYEQLKAKAKGGGLDTAERKEFRELYYAIKEYDSAIKDARQSEVELGLAMKEAEAITVKKVEAIKDLSGGMSAADAAAVTLKDTFDKLFASVNKNDIFTKLGDDIKNKLITAIEAAVHPLQRINDLLTSIAVKATNPLEGMKDSVLSELGPVQYGVDSLFESMNKNAEAPQAMGDAFASMASAVGGALGNALGQWAGFAGKLIAEIIKIIAASRAAATAQAIAGASAAGAATGPASPFTTPAFIASAIAGIAGAFASIPKFATGGAVTGPTLAMIGENPASRGEAIIPFERMGSFLQQFGMGTNGDQHITISGQLAGDTIRLSGESATNKIASVRWGRGTALVN